MFDVSCVGILTADILAKPVDRLPGKGLLGRIDRLEMHVGGCAANAAIDLVRLGASVQIFGKLGCDSFGRFVKNELAAEGVDAGGLSEDTGAQTAASVVAVSADGERTVLHSMGANARFRLEDIDYGRLKQARILFVAGSFLMPAFDGEGAAALLRRARADGLVTCLDTAWDASGRWMEVLGPCLPALDWFLPSYEEAVQLSGQTQPDSIAAAFLAAGAKNVVVKLGKRGCYVREGGRAGVFVPTFDCVAAVDTSGAGDSFCAGFLMGLLQGWDAEAAALFANAVGTHCVMEVGATAGVRSMTETLRFMEAHPLTKGKEDPEYA